MAFLVQFPLRINSETGKYSLNDPAALQSRFQEVFPAAVRKAILDQKVQEISCRDEGIAYGNGDAWVNVAKFGFAIESIEYSGCQCSQSLESREWSLSVKLIN